MDTFPCPVCGEDVAEGAATCPSCGESMGVTLFEPLELRRAALADPTAASETADTAAYRPARVAPRGPIFARFLISSVLREPLELEAGHVFRIGRGKQTEVCFPSNHVSRLHAEVVHENGAWVIGDLESKNGTFVNGERVLRRRLKHGDKVSIGHFELTFLELTKEETFELLRSQLDPSGEDTAPLRGEMDGLFGDLARLAVAEVVQLLNQARRTGYLKVEGLRSAPVGVVKLFFAEGEIAHAVYGEVEGERAAMRILRLEHGQFQFVRTGPPQRRTIEAQTNGLLLAAASSD